MRARARLVEQVGGELRRDELVVRQVVVERLDHPVAIEIRVRIGVVAAPHRIEAAVVVLAVARDVEPLRPQLRRSAATRAGDRPPSRRRRATCRLRTRRPPPASAAGRSGRAWRGGAACACRRRAPARARRCSSRASTKRSMSVFGHAASRDRGRAGVRCSGWNDQNARCSAVMIALARRRQRRRRRLVAVGRRPRRAAANPLGERVDLRSGSLAPSFGIRGSVRRVPHGLSSRLLSGSPGTIAGPDLPPLSSASRESRRSPPFRSSVWQSQHVVDQHRPDAGFEEFQRLCATAACAAGGGLRGPEAAHSATAASAAAAAAADEIRAARISYASAACVSGLLCHGLSRSMKRAHLLASACRRRHPCRPTRTPPPRPKRPGVTDSWRLRIPIDTAEARRGLRRSRRRPTGWPSTSDVWVSNSPKTHACRGSIPKTNTSSTTIAVGKHPCSGLAAGFGSLWVPELRRPDDLARRPQDGQGRPATLAADDRQQRGRRGHRRRQHLDHDRREGHAGADRSGDQQGRRGDLRRARIVRRRLRRGRGVGHEHREERPDARQPADQRDRGDHPGRTEAAVPRRRRRRRSGRSTRATASISRVDPKTNKVVATIEAGIPGGGGEIAVGEGSVWVTSFEFPLTRIDPATNKVVQQFYGEGGDAIRVGLGSVWLSNLRPAMSGGSIRSGSSPRSQNSAAYGSRRRGPAATMRRARAEPPRHILHTTGRGHLGHRGGTLRAGAGGRGPQPAHRAAAARRHGQRGLRARRPGHGIARSWFWIQLLVPGALLLGGYWLSGFFFRAPQPWLEAWRWSRPTGALRRARNRSRAAGRAAVVLEPLEASYAADYLVVGAGAIVPPRPDARRSRITGRRAGGGARLLRGAAVAAVASAAGARGAGRDGSSGRRRLRRLNVAILDRASVQANTHSQRACRRGRGGGVGGDAGERRRRRAVARRGPR